MHLDAIPQRRAHARDPASTGRWAVTVGGVTVIHRHLWKVIAVTGLLCIAPYYVLPSPLGPDLVYAGMGLGAVVAIVFGVRLHRVSDRTGWYLIAAAVGCYFCGDVVFNVYELVLRTPPPNPSAADVLYLAGSPLLFAGLLRQSRH